MQSDLQTVTTEVIAPETNAKSGQADLSSESTQAHPQTISPVEGTAVTPELTSKTNWKPSFDCTKATIFAENAICTDSLLGKLDGVLSENYTLMLSSNIGEGASKDLKATQKKWLSDRNKCTTNQCLTDVYLKRIDEVCDYPVISGVHANCTSSDDVK